MIDVEPSVTTSIAKTIERNWHNISEKEVKITDHVSEYINSVQYLFDAAVENSLCINARAFYDATTKESKLLLDFVTEQKKIVDSFVISFQFLHEILSRRENLTKYFQFNINESDLSGTNQSEVSELIAKIKKYFGLT